MEELSALKRRLSESARRGTEEYVREYIDSFELVAAVAAPSEHKLIREVYSASAADAFDAIKVAALYNEVSVLTIGVSEGASVNLLNPQKFAENGGFKLTVPTVDQQLIKSINEGSSSCGLMMPSGDNDNQLLNDLSPLIKSGRVVVSPRRFVMYDTGKLTPEGGRMWGTHETDPFAPIDIWEVSTAPTTKVNKTFTDAAIATQSRELKSIDQLSEIILPYIKNMPLSDYSKLLEDESHNILPFQNFMKDYMNKNFDGMSAEQFRLEVIRPQIAKIQKDFEKISRASNIRMGGLVLGSAALCAATLSTSGVAAAIVAVAGTAGLVGGAKELGDRSEKIAGLSESPLHILWKLQRVE